MARDVFERVDAALSQNLSQLMFEGPEAELTLTANAQPALMAASIAAVRVLETETVFKAARQAAFVAGHSLGEYSALCAAGSLTLEDAARLLRLRGEAMQKAVPVGEGAMAAILGLEFGLVVRIATEAASDLYLTGAICQAANDNGGGPGGDLGHEGGGRARDGVGQARRGQASADSAGVRAIPLRADAAGRVGDGGGAEKRRDSSAQTAARRQRDGVRGLRSGDDPHRASSRR